MGQSKPTLDVHFTSKKSLTEIKKFAKDQRYSKKLKDKFEFAGSMRVVESLLTSQIIEERDFNEAYALFSSGKFIDSITVKWQQ